jgi:hypothetical protein
MGLALPSNGLGVVLTSSSGNLLKQMRFPLGSKCSGGIYGFAGAGSGTLPSFVMQSLKYD